jgi:hypothetical protein
MSQEGRSLVLKEIENAFPQAVATKELLRKFRPETKASLNRLLYEMLSNDDIRRVSVSPPTWTLSKAPVGNTSAVQASRQSEDQELQDILKDLPVIEQQLVCELHDTAPKLSQTDELASALGITNIHDVSRHLQSLRQRGLVVSQEERGSLFWTCSPVREKGERCLEGRYQEKPSPIQHSPQQAANQKREVYQPYNQQQDRYNQHPKQQSQGYKSRGGHRNRGGRRRQCYQQPYRQHDGGGNLGQHHQQEQEHEEDDSDLMVPGLGDGRSIQFDGDSLKISVTFKQPEAQVQETGLSPSWHSQKDIQVISRPENETQLSRSISTKDSQRNRQEIVPGSRMEAQLLRHSNTNEQVQPVVNMENGIQESTHAGDHPIGSGTYHSTASNVSSNMAVNSLPFSSLMISPSSGTTPQTNTAQPQQVISPFPNAPPQHPLKFGLLPRPLISAPPVLFSSPTILSKKSMERPSLDQMQILVGSSVAPFQASAPGIRPLNRPPTQFGFSNQGSTPRIMPPEPRPVYNRLSPPMALSVGHAKSLVPVRPSVPITNIKQYQLAELCAKNKLELQYTVKQFGSGKWMATVRYGNDEVTQTGCNSDVEAKEMVAEAALLQLQKKLTQTQESSLSTQQACVSDSCVSDIDYKWLLKIQCEEHYKVTPKFSVKRVGGRHAGMVEIGTNYAFTTPKPYPTRKQAEMEAAKLALHSLDLQG